MFEIIGLYLLGKALFEREIPNMLAPNPVITMQSPVYVPIVQPENIPIPTLPKAKPKETKSVKLLVPFYRQIYTLSCEMASLQMALEAKGIKKTQDELISLIGNSNPRESYIKNGEMIWGDPDIGFVGDINGKFSTGDFDLRTATGWGVANIPVGRTAKMFLPKSEAYAGFTTKQIKTELENGNPVIFWHKQDSFSTATIYYKTETGKEIKFTRDHVAVVTGYKVIEGVNYFMINDPQYGVYTISEKTLARWMTRLESDVVVIR
jgi:uncharacterized protein YvpB